MMKKLWKKLIFGIFILIAVGMAGTFDKVGELADKETAGIRVRLHDTAHQPLSGVDLSIWQQGFDESEQSVITDANGEAVFAVQPGRYTLGGDISSAGGRYFEFRQYQTGIETRLYYISPEVNLLEGRILVLTVNPREYIDVVDIHNDAVGAMRIKRRNGRLDLVIRPEWRANRMRLYLPLRYNYQIGPVNESKFVVIPEFYAAPGTVYSLRR